MAQQRQTYHHKDLRNALIETGIQIVNTEGVNAFSLRKVATDLLLENKSNPEMEIDKVTTPGGITIKGLNEMEMSGFTSSVIKGLKASK